MNDKTAITDQRPTTNDPIHVALAVYDPKGTYSQHGGVTITSIFENTKSKVIVYILHDETLTEDNRRKFIRTAEKYSQELELIDIREYTKLLGDDFVRISHRYTIGTLYRLFIPDVLPQLEKVIYVDCDVLFDMDIKEFWEIDMENNIIVGALDMPELGGCFSFRDEKMKLVLNGSRPEKYINAGVIMIDLKRMRERGNLFHIASEWILRRDRMAPSPDQDALNSIFCDDIKVISNRFNNNTFKMEASDCIIHMLQGKSWDIIRGASRDRIYWKMYLRSAWGENTTRDELIDILNDVIKNQKQPPKKTILKKLRTLIFHYLIPGRAIKFILKDITARLKYKFRH